MVRGILLLVLAGANPAFGQGVQTLPALPANTYANAVQVDSAGYVRIQAPTLGAKAASFG
ncbi:MAG: hypothetical protein ABSH49_28065 [Bryobacteraceae bacterium]|jgi:hypothetical protein